MKVDEDGLIEGIFWADHIMQNDYLIFGDFLSFDTTYQTNADSLPLGVFIGVNNHGEQIVFAACLLYSESAVSFEWVFNVFLECMNGKVPKSIITDQDAAMLSAISKAFPNTGHFLCTWHINQNALKHIGHLFGNENLKKCWSELLFSSDILDFEGAWSTFITKYQLKDNEWLQRIYSRREMWAPVYVRKTFCAGKRSTQMSESFNSKLRQYLKANMDLGPFFQQFQRAVESVRQNELESNFQMQNQRPLSRVNDPLCDHIATIYTPNMLRQFELEAEQSLYVKSDSISVVPEGEKIIVHIHVRLHDCNQAAKHEVFIASDNVICSCKEFSFIGIPCCHMLWVMRRYGFDSELPEKYILQCWTKTAHNVGIAPAEAILQPTSGKDEQQIWYQQITSAINAQVLKHIRNRESWGIWDQWLAFVTSELDALTFNKMQAESAEQSKHVHSSKLLVGDGGVCRGLKIRERKIKGNKRPKSVLERFKKSRSVINRNFALRDEESKNDDDITDLTV